MVKIRCHHDADGTSAAYGVYSALLSQGIIKSDEIPQVWDGYFGYPTDLKEEDYLVDMKPSIPCNCNIIDHHVDYTNKQLNNGKLLYPGRAEDWPATKLVMNKYIKNIPKSEWWKLVPGLYGDVKPELCPINIDGHGIRYYFPQFFMLNEWGYNELSNLSCSYNALTRLRSYLPGNGWNGFNEKYEDLWIDIIIPAKKPKDIIQHKLILQAKEILKIDASENIPKNSRIWKGPKNFHNDIYLNGYDSDYRMSGRIHFDMMDCNNYGWQNRFRKEGIRKPDEKNSTVVNMENKTKRGSIRGPNTDYYIKEIFSKIPGFTSGGHPGIKGITLKDNLTVDKFMDKSIELINELELSYIDRILRGKEI